MDDRALARKLGEPVVFASARSSTVASWPTHTSSDYRELMIDRPRLTPVGSGR